MRATLPPSRFRTEQRAPRRRREGVGCGKKMRMQEEKGLLRLPYSELKINKHLALLSNTRRGVPPQKHARVLEAHLGLHLALAP